MDRSRRRRRALRLILAAAVGLGIVGGVGVAVGVASAGESGTVYSPSDASVTTPSDSPTFAGDGTMGADEAGWG